MKSPPRRSKFANTIMRLQRKLERGGLRSSVVFGERMGLTAPVMYVQVGQRFALTLAAADELSRLRNPADVTRAACALAALEGEMDTTSGGLSTVMAKHVREVVGE